jgi:hypothetical protein
VSHQRIEKFSAADALSGIINSKPFETVNRVFFPLCGFLEKAFIALIVG